MATATTRPAPPTHIDPRVSHPLDRLRGTVRRYVLIEGLLAAAIFVAGWFALGMLLDFGLFKVATWDWALDAPRWFRGVALVAAVLLLASIVTFRIVRRLTKELSYPALALVLERRFPKVLGDRLITAVELADVEGQARYGYSRDLILETIHEARERVGTVPVNDVFNWRRLRVMGLIAGGLVLGVLLTGFVGYVVATGSASPYRFGWRFAHVSGVFLERNALLQNTPWPRRAHLELVRFPGDELRVGKDAPAPTVRARAYRWVVADSGARMGWRPMAWGDVTDKLIGGPVPELPADAFRAAADPGELAGDPAGWPVDRVQALGLDDPAARAKLAEGLHPDLYVALQTGLERVFAGLDEQAARPSMGRRLRKLDIPERVTLLYRGQEKSGDVTLSPQQNQEFAGAVSDLKESVTFVVRAEDFRTTPKTITLVPPPRFKTLNATEYQPAYLHHAPPQDQGYPALRGQRQRMPDRPLSLTGDRSVVPVPSGTELVLTAVADTDLTAAYLQPKVGILPWAKPGSADWVPVAIGEDGRTVTVEFRGDYRLAAGRAIDHYFFDDQGQGWVEKVTTTAVVEFDLIVEQADGVRSRRQLLIQVAEDQPPTVEVAVDTVRKVGNVYYVTPVARIPFNPESAIRDDHGLSKVAYEFAYWPEDSEGVRAMRAGLVTRALLYPPTPTVPGGVVAPAYHAVKFKDLDKGDTRQTGSAEVGRFFDLRRDLVSETPQRFRELLAQPFAPTDSRVVTRVELKSPDVDFFDLKGLKLAAGVSDVQTRYRMDLNVVATDTNYDTGPRTGENAEPIRLLIVSEGDLLGEINKEEEAFATRLDEALAKLAGARKKYDYIRSRNGGPPDPGEIDTARVRAQDASQDVAKARDVVGSVVRDYRRIYRECVFNRVTQVTTDKFGAFANRIDRVLGENPAPVSDEERRQAEAKLLDPRMTFPTAEKRMEAVLDTLTQGRWVDPAAFSDTEVAMLTLEQELTAIRKALGELQTKDKLRDELKQVVERQKRIRKELTEWRIKAEADLTRKDPKIGTVGPVLLGKGETKKLKHALNWRQYDKDDLVVKVTTSDAAGVTAPTELKLNFERNQFDFEYDVKAGAKEGQYTLTLTPEVGDPVKVEVTVK